MPEKNAIENAHEVMFFYSKIRIYVYFVIATILLVFGLLLYSANNNEFPVFEIAVIGMALYLFISRTIRLFSKSPQLIINENGIQIRKLPFNNWSVVDHIEFEHRRNGKALQQYLVIWMRGKKQEVQIDELDHKKKFIASHIEKCRALHQCLSIAQGNGQVRR